MARYRGINADAYSVIAGWEVSNDNGATWGAASQLPTVVDEVYANGFTKTIDVDSFASFYSTRAATGVSAGGSFPYGAGTKATGDAYAGTTSCVTNSTANAKVLIGNSYASNTTGATGGVANTGNGNVTIVGSSYGGNPNNSHGAYNATSVGYINITGEAVGGTSANQSGLRNLLGGGPCIVGVARAAGGPGVWSDADITIGTAISVGSVIALRGATTGVFTVGNYITNGLNMLDSTSASKYVRMTSNGQITMPIAPSGSGVFNAFASQGQASPADVRLGTSYANGALTGTCAVPPAGSVSLGVPVDATTGTGSVSSAEIRDLILPSILSAITAP
jgi:hypothetical protein